MLEKEGSGRIDATNAARIRDRSGTEGEEVEIVVSNEGSG